jgi:hypothetical protein
VRIPAGLVDELFDRARRLSVLPSDYAKDIVIAELLARTERGRQWNGAAARGTNTKLRRV